MAEKSHSSRDFADSSPRGAGLDYTALFAHLPGLFLILGPGFEIVAATDAFLAATMTVRGEILGRRYFEVFPDNPDDPRATGVVNMRASLDRVVETRKPDSMAVQKYELRKRVEGHDEFEVRYWSAINSPILDGDGNLELIVHRVEDVTGFVEFRGEGSASGLPAPKPKGDMEWIQAEILRRSAELHDSNVDLRAASDAKSVFLSRMSHELRSPLTAILGYSELLKIESDPSAEAGIAAEAIHRAGTHLLALINEVLDISQIESGQQAMSIESVAIESVIESALELVQPIADRCGAKIAARRTPTALYVASDAQRLKQVFINLLTNAVKYNAENGAVSVNVVKSAGDRVRITISDTGPGIEPEDLERIFRPFERVGGGSPEVEGTGLGLSISKDLVELMGGTIAATSVVGEGTTFAIELRASSPKIVSERPVDASPELGVIHYSTPRELLCIEDASANLRLVERVLRRRPQVHVIPTMYGELGVDLAREYHPDLILLELHLPDTNGAMVLSKLKSDAETRDIPVVVLSADATRLQESEVLDLGAESYLTKPIELATLLRTVDDHLSGDRTPPDRLALS